MAKAAKHCLTLAAVAGFHSAPAAAGQLAPPAQVNQAEDEVIIVTGTRIPRPSEDGLSPTQTLRSEELTLTGVPNVEQTLNQLPQLTPSFTNTSNNPGTGAATLSLRGLGSVRTLVLVNGRRWIANDAGQTPEVDVNTIPAALIERIDVVTGGASAVYGSDAVTGVVNFILDTRFEGVRLEARQNITERGDGRVSAADLVAGTRFAGDRGHVVASIGWLSQDPVTAAERPLSQVTLQDGCGVPGTRDETGASRPVGGICLMPNELTLIAGGSFTVPGGRIGGGGAGIFFPVTGTTTLVRTGPPGVLFDPGGQPRIFDTALDLYNFAPENYLQVGLQRWSGNLLASFDLSPVIRPYLEAAFVRTTSPQQLASVPAAGRNLRLNLDNPFLTPEARQLLEVNFGVDAQGDRAFAGSATTGFRLNPVYGGDADGFVTVGPSPPFIFQSRLGLGPRRIVNRREAARGLVGAAGDLSSEWGYDLFYSRSRAEHRTDYGNSGSAARLRQALLARRDPATGQIACIDPSGGCVPANIFGAGNLSEGAADFIRTDPSDLTIVDEQVAEMSVRGSLPFLVVEPIGLVLGTTWRRTAYDYQPDPALFTGDDLGFFPGTPAAGSTSVREIFGEARVPLKNRLSAELGLRWSSYSTVGSVWTWKALGEWEPITGLRLRGGWQRAERAPNVRELFEEETVVGATIRDPCASGSGVFVEALIQAACARDGVEPEVAAFLPPSAFVPFATFGGNPDLEAEVARTFTIGAVVTPNVVPGLSVTLDYYDIRIRRAIATFGGGGDFLVYGCILGGGDPGDALCSAYDRGADGSLVSAEFRTANLPEIRARGVDWQLAFDRDVWSGHIDLLLSGTRYLDNSFTPNRSLPAFECAGLFGAPCGNTISGTATPRWKLYNRLTWTVRNVAMTLRHRWFSATRDARGNLAAFLGMNPQPLPLEGRRLEDRHYLDLGVALPVGERFRLTIGVNNLAGTRPAITGINQVQSNTDPSLYDVLGRRYFLALSVRLD